MKYKIIAFALFSFFLFPSCGNSWIDEAEPSTSVETSKSIKTDKDAQYTLNGTYATLRGYEYYGARMTFYGDVTGDDMQASGGTKRAAYYYLFNYNRETIPNTFWVFPYKVIANANNILVYIDGLSGDLTAAQKDIKGQALTLRAMVHFDLVKLYGLPYTKDNGASMGVPIMLKKQDQLYKPARNTVAEVYSQVINDLETAGALLDKKPKLGKLNWFGSQLLLARAHLYMANNAKAYEVADNVIVQAKSEGYTLWTNDEYPKMWAKEGTSEVFFEILIKASEAGPGNEGMGYLMWNKGYNDIVITTDFLNLMKKDTEDVRNKMVSLIGKLNYLMKYPGNDGEIPSYANVPVLRLSEAYLIAAEAAVKLENNTNALKYLNAIVERANPNATVDGTVTLDRVLEERRKELVGEGHRFFDAMRNNKRIERKGSSHLSALTAEAKSFDWNYFKIVMAIPKTEMDTNPNMKQNQGY